MGMSVLTFSLDARASLSRPHNLNFGHNHIYFAPPHSGFTKERHPQLRQRSLELTDRLKRRRRRQRRRQRRLQSPAAVTAAAMPGPGPTDSFQGWAGSVATSQKRCLTCYRDYQPLLRIKEMLLDHHGYLVSEASSTNILGREGHIRCY